jgi:ribosomal protein S27AE
LYRLTADGYIIAQDVDCQYEYARKTSCPHCGGALVIAAHLNRAGQGLSELVALCQDCRQRTSFIFDISNDVFQAWWAEQLGPLYIRQYDGPPREPVTE